MAHAVYCDRKECDTWQFVEKGQEYPLDDLWTKVCSGNKEWLFCSLWCTVVGLVDIAEPTETIEWDTV